MSDGLIDEKPKRKKRKKFTAAERKALGLDKFPDTMYDFSQVRERGPRYPEYEHVKPPALDFSK